jgi:hypothetical protein
MQSSEYGRAVLTLRHSTGGMSQSHDHLSAMSCLQQLLSRPRFGRIFASSYQALARWEDTSKLCITKSRVAQIALGGKGMTEREKLVAVAKALQWTHSKATIGEPRKWGVACEN